MWVHPKNHPKEREKRLYVALGDRTRSCKFFLMYRIIIQRSIVFEHRVGSPRK